MWEHCLKRLEAEIPKNEILLWIRPLEVSIESNHISLLASNDVVLDKIESLYFKSISAAIKEIFGQGYSSSIKIHKPYVPEITEQAQSTPKNNIPSNIDHRFVFDNFIEGRSNTIALAAALQTAQTPNPEFNPLLLYGSTGLGKTHLLHSIGNEILKNNPDEVVCYLHSEIYVNEMVKAIQQKSMELFKQKYRSVTTLLIDDIQFFARKERTQEEFFHTFNYLLEGQKRVIITCDRYPKEVNGLESRLKSRLGWGIVVPIDPPDYETRVVILKEKAKHLGFTLDDDVAFYIAKQLNSNIRELEGALSTLKANAFFTGKKIDLTYTKQILKELFKVNHQIVSVENIQKTTAQYYNVKLSELLGKSRKRSIVRPRQLAMYLAKDLTDKSYPEIGESFGGRDHTTVLHAYKKMDELLSENNDLNEDKQKIVNKLTE
ncbi:chromosomal replication initiator protein DnaA [Marinicella litoralis]|uniref:Chromosomal replication initiator protein DnaA n=1 Tax=Marinicella litoralis TaxID=644220 RepID=A0A4R6Y0R0_9GAMM|nr:chromosomal replication initiator protein DnaA [Marinicella litoralis]TDR23713.1 chromosomal replication initiator protein DnaA [Marinicella litoralis]